MGNFWLATFLIVVGLTGYTQGIRCDLEEFNACASITSLDMSTDLALELALNVTEDEFKKQINTSCKTHLPRTIECYEPYRYECSEHLGFKLMGFGIQLAEYHCSPDSIRVLTNNFACLFNVSKNVARVCLERMKKEIHRGVSPEMLCSVIDEYLSCSLSYLDCGEEVADYTEGVIRFFKEKVYELIQSIFNVDCDIRDTPVAAARVSEISGTSKGCLSSYGLMLAVMGVVWIFYNRLL